MFYTLPAPKVCNGSNDFVDISSKLHSFLQHDILGARICFSTTGAGYQCLLGVYFKESLLPTFALYLHKGYPAVVTRQKDKQIIFTATQAYNDGKSHEMVFYGDAKGFTLWLDGTPLLCEEAGTAYCQYNYVGFATLGRGVVCNQYDGFFEGTLLAVALANAKILPQKMPTAPPNEPSIVLFERGMLGSENFRIPALITTPKGTVIATADARLDAPGDNPNHIGRAVRVSHDSGQHWDDPQLVLDHGGVGREHGAAAIDAALVCDAATNRVFMLYGHTPAGFGSALSEGCTGFDATGRRLLWDSAGKVFFAQENGTIVDEHGAPTGDTVDARGVLFQNGQPIGSVCHGENRVLREANTTFLQYIYSDDEGKSWQGPVELNPQVKAPWMGFLGPGPGCGIQIVQGMYAGRLVVPVYFQSRIGGLYSCAVVYSDDHGQHWSCGEAVSKGRMFEGEIIDPVICQNPRAVTSESQVVELAHGVLKLFMRSTNAGRVATALSEDGGQSWHTYALDDALTDPSCQCSILRAEHEGKPCWVFSNPAHATLRVKGALKFSDDGTRTWRYSREIDAGEYGYSCMTQMPNGQIGLLYEGLDIAQRFVSVPLSWLMEAPS